MALLQIGIDDTDSKQGMCTTYVGAVVIKRLEALGVKLRGHPKLIRLNPNWKMKTRGNCAVAFSISVKNSQIPLVKEIVLRTVEELAELHIPTTNPGVVFYPRSKITAEMSAFSKKVVQDVVSIEEAEALARKVGAEVHKFKLGRGIVGALAAISNTLKRDWTFEIISYRAPKNRGTIRKVDKASVLRMNSKTYPQTFDNVDPATGEVRITPHTPCPILYGIRGESLEDVARAQKMVRTSEQIEQLVAYKTNQGTDEHLRMTKIGEAKPNWSVIVDGTVCKTPRIITGGHVIFRIKDETGEIDCAAYEPTRQFRGKIKKLIIGDRLRVCGGIKDKPELPLTINLEKIEVLKPAPLLKKENPKCSKCGKRMKSEGKNKGYSCKVCKIRTPTNSAKIVKLPREIHKGKFEVPPRARRHLARPLVRNP